LLGEGSLTDAALQTINGHHDGGPLKHFYEPVQQAFVVVRSWLEVFFQDELGHPGRLEQPVLGRSLVETPRNINRQSN
jgi:hypothetical protein